MTCCSRPVFSNGLNNFLIDSIGTSHKMMRNESTRDNKDGSVSWSQHVLAHLQHRQKPFLLPGLLLSLSCLVADICFLMHLCVSLLGWRLGSGACVNQLWVHLSPYSFSYTVTTQQPNLPLNFGNSIQWDFSSRRFFL